MGKLPAYLHWAKDWLTDVDLCRCSKAAKGVWIDVLDIMFLNCIRGVACSDDGSPWSDEDLARAIGGDLSENVTCIRELLTKGVAHRNNRGAIFSRRMVNDEKERQSNKGRQRKHRNAISNSDVTVDITALSGDGTGRVLEVDSKDLSEAVFEIAKIHPRIAHRVKGPSRIEQEAIAQAIALAGRDEVTKGTRRLADAVAKWPEHEIKFAPEPVKFYQQEDYRKPASHWDRSETSKLAGSQGLSIADAEPDAHTLALREKFAKQHREEIAQKKKALVSA